jgi:MYXO-CTERM domain-containing protein
MRTIASRTVLLTLALAVPALASIDASTYFENFDGPSAAVMPATQSFTGGQILQNYAEWMGGNATSSQIRVVAASDYTSYGADSGLAMRLLSRASTTPRVDLAQWCRYALPDTSLYGATTSAANIFRIDISILQGANAAASSAVYWSAIPKYSTNVNPLGGVSGFVGWRGGTFTGGSGYVQTRAQANVSGTPALGAGAIATYYNGASAGYSIPLQAGWNTLTIFADYGSTADPTSPYPDYVGQVAYLVNGTLYEVDTGVHFSGGPGENSVGALEFNNEINGPGSGSSVYFDNLSVNYTGTFVPEPAGLALLGIAAIPLLRRRRR